MENANNSASHPSAVQRPAAQPPQERPHNDDHPPSEASAPQPVITVVKEIHCWTCDYCGKPFPTYTEACTHEQLCQQHPQPQSNPSSTMPCPTTMLVKTNNDHPSTDPSSAAQQSLPMSKHTTSNRTRTKQVRPAAAEEGSSSPHDAAAAAVPRPACGPWIVAASRCSKAKLLSSSTATTKNNLSSSSETRATRNKRSVIDLASSDKHNTTTTTAQSDSNKKKRTTATKTNNNNPKKPTKSSHAASSTNSTSSVVPLASIFHAAGVTDNQERQRLLQEQATANFRAQRLEKERKQRELRLKKQQSAAAVQTAPAVGPTTVESLCHSPTRTMKRLNASAPRFPVPSHVFPGPAVLSTVLSSPSSSPWWKDQNGSSAKRTKEQHRGEELPSIVVRDWYKTILHNCDGGAEPASYTVDPLQQLLRETLLPPQQRTRSSSQNCWAEQYYETHKWTKDCPIRHQLRQFVQEWMIARHQAHVKLQHKQRQLAKQRGNAKNRRLGKKKSKKKSNYNDDDLWESDSDVERDGLPSLCLLTGPIGSGKTSMVHAVAKECKCSVMEINTTDKRSAAALKRMLEETTQSHSSLDMLQSKQFFQTRHESLVDTDAESDADSDRSDSDDDKSSKQPQRALTLILIDEVDLLFEDDAGFWSALHQLAKRSKSPIVLTANSTPPGIHTCRSLPLVLSKPTNAQYEDFIRHVLQEEGFRWRMPDDLERNRVLAYLVELCHNDLRKVCRELQLYSHSTTDQLPPSSGEANASIHSERSDASIDVLMASVKLMSVEPRSVLRDSYALLTIRGSGFLNLIHPKSGYFEGGGYGVVVNVGGRICPCARILNDTTVLAVKAPNIAPRHDVQNLHGTLPRLSCCDEYETVSLCSVQRRGVASTTEGSLSHHSTATGGISISLANPLYILSQLSSTTLPITPDNEETDDEAEFELECSEREPTTASSSLPYVSASTDWERVDQMMQDGLLAWKNEISPRIEPEAPALAVPVAVELPKSSEVDLLVQQTSWASDASILQDLACQGLPFLSKSCRGFGFEYTDAVPASSKDKSKPPTEERLCQLGWKEDHYFYGNCDTYMTSMTSSREQQLLKRQESFRSCIPPSSMNVVTSSDSSDSSAGVDSADNPCYADDALFPNCAPTCICSFVSSLMHQCPPQRRRSCQSSWTTSQLPDTLLSDRTLVRMQEHLELLSLHLFTTDMYRARLFVRGLSRSVDVRCLAPTEECDAAIFLDYLPMLRVMAWMDQDLRALAVLQHSKDEEVLLLTSRTKRRSTRTSQRRKLHDGRHFLSELLPATYYYSNDSNEDDNDMDSAFGIVDRLAQGCLLQPVANLMP